MAENSKIEWCDHTFNPWEGCTKVSPGCAHCYAEARNARFGGGHAPNWGKGAPRRRTSVHNWNEPVRWNRAAQHAAELYAAGGGKSWQRPRVFCASLADWLDDEVPVEWLADLLDLIQRTPHLDWLLLTKRPGNWNPRLLEVLTLWCRGRGSEAGPWLADWLSRDCKAPANVWIGTTVEDQKRADERIPALLSIPARVRFLSCEPLLGAVEFSNVTHRSDCVAMLGKPALTGIHWVICGGESGPGARPMHPNWARSIRNQCAAVGVPFLFKQWGEWAPVFHPQDADEIVGAVNTFPKGHWFEPTGKRGEHKTWHCVMIERLGKHAAGRLLDGVEHNGFPEVAS